MTTPNAGWYDDGSGRQRWWDGSQWTDQYQPSATPAPPTPGASVRGQQALAQAVAWEVSRGARAEFQSENNASLLKGKKPNHVLHLILSLITAGLWLIVWLVLVLTLKQTRITLYLDPSGQVIRQESRV